MLISYHKLWEHRIHTESVASKQLWYRQNCFSKVYTIGFYFISWNPVDGLVCLYLKFTFCFFLCLISIYAYGNNNYFSELMSSFSPMSTCDTPWEFFCIFCLNLTFLSKRWWDSEFWRVNFQNTVIKAALLLLLPAIIKPF